MSQFNPTSLIKSATEGDTINLKKICQILGLRLKICPDLKDLCRICLDEDRHVVIQLKENLDKRTKFTLVAIAIAEYIISSDRVRDTGVNYDIFFVRDIHANRSTNLIMLATRLTMPEHIIEKIASESEVTFSRASASDKFDVDAYIENSDYLPEFIRSAIKESSSKLLLDSLTTR